MAVLELLKQKTLPSYKESDEHRKINEFLDERIKQLKQARKNVFGQDIDKLMEKADKDCQVTEEITIGTGKKVLAENEELGLRGVSSFVDLGIENWQSHIASNDPYVKLLIALSILFDNDPKAELSPAGKKYVAITEVTKQLFENSWRVSHSREILKKFIFDLGKYGYAIGRTRLNSESRMISEIVEYDPKTHKVKEEERELNNFIEVVRERLDPHRTWIDDKAKANERNTINDWAWEKDYSYDDLEAEFGDNEMFKFVQIGGGDAKDETLSEESDKKLESKTYVVQFYENRKKDRFITRVKTGGHWLIFDNTPLPYDHKELSCWTTIWNLRHPDTIYGVSPIELMRGDKKLKNKVKNMTIDQLVLSIYKMGFYEKTATAFKGQTKLQIKPGHLEEGVANVNWLDIPGPGQDAKFGIQYLQDEIDNETGITPQLGGEVLGKTAYEIGQAKESALKRLKLPLDNISYALEIEAELSIPLMWQAYTTPLVEHLVNKQDIDDFLKEVNNDPKFYFWDEDKQFFAKRYREFELAVEEKGGIYTFSGDKKFFYTMPQFQRWKGVVKIRATSLLSTWKELEKQQKREMTKTVIELLQLGQAIGLKPLKQLLLAFNENPNDWIPDNWLHPQESPQGRTAVRASEMFGRENLPPEMASLIPESTTAVNKVEANILPV